MKSRAMAGHAKVVLLLFLVSLLHLHPILPRFFSALPYPFIGDVNLTLGILHSDLHKLAAGDFAGLHHLPFLFPYSYVLTMGFTMFGQALALLPLHLLGVHNIYLIYNLCVFLCFILAGFAAYLFFRELTDHQPASLVAACLYMLLPGRVLNLPHLNLLCNFAIPFCFFHLFRYLKGNRVRDLVGFNVFLLVQFLFDLSLGFHLAVAAAFFCLIFMIIKRRALAGTVWRLIFTLIPTALIVGIIHMPYLLPELSWSSMAGTFDPAQYIPSSNFYSARSYLFSLLGGRWGIGPYWLGFIASFLFLFALRSGLRRRSEKAVWGWILVCQTGTIPLLAVFSRRWTPAALELVTDISLVMLLVALAMLLSLLGSRLHFNLRVASWTYLALVAVSFRPMARFFDLYGILAHLFSFLSRSRGVLRTMYLFSLMALAVVAFGLRYFLERRRRKAAAIILLALLMAGELVRWPISVGRLEEPSEQAQAFYREIGRMPDCSGILDLPWIPEAMNIYPLFTRYHDKHTYPGLYLYYENPLDLVPGAEMDESRGFPGLKQGEFIRRLVQNRLRIILIHKEMFSSPAAWLAAKQNVRQGRELGFYERVEIAHSAMLLVLRDRMEGRRLLARLPYYFFVGKKRLLFRLAAPAGCPAQVRFNGRVITSGVEGLGGLWQIDLKGMALYPQLNDLQVIADLPVVLEEIRLE